MRKDFFYRFGEIIFKFRWWFVVLWLLLFLSCLPFVSKLMDPFKAVGFTDQCSESAHANKVLNNKIGYGYNRFIIMYSSDTMLATNPKFLQEIKDSLSKLENFSIPNKIIYPDATNKQISKDKKSAYAVILIKGNQELDESSLKRFIKVIQQPPTLKMYMGGEPIFLQDTKKQTEIDLYKAEYIATPVAIITMLIVFGSVVAASLPIVLGGICALIILMTLSAIGHFLSLSIFTLNIALLLGLCLSLDYSLLIINRFKDEISKSNFSIKDVIATTQTTAGKAVFFSGSAVFISLSALLLFPINVLFSVGVGGLVAVFIAVSMSIILLPAVLAILENKINLLPIKFFYKRKASTKSYWHEIVLKVIKHPALFLIGILLLLLLMGYPFLKVKFGISDFRILPKTLQSRQVFDIFKSNFGESKLEPVLVVIKSKNEDILSKKNIAAMYDFSEHLQKDFKIDQINSIFSITPKLSKEQYQNLYQSPPEHLPPRLQELLDLTTQDDTTVMTITTKFAADSVATSDFIKKLRNYKLGNGLSFELTGTSVNTNDVLHSIGKVFPYAFLWIIGFTYLILLIFLRSIILPLKAIVMTILSLSASYGVLVLVIQQGFLSNLLNFEPQGLLDISLLIIIFCALFGISMDYEVFLLTRIKECYEQTHDNLKSIIFGIDRSFKIITSAAIIVILICFSFMTADILIVKAFGLGIAVAVFIDAFVIRATLVPATMALLGRFNWYLPRWLDRILPNITFDPETNHLTPPQPKM